MAHRLERLSQRWRWIILFIVVLVVVVALVFFRRHSGDDGHDASSAAIAQMQSIEVAVTVVGSIGVADRIEISAPFDSVIRRLPVRHGQEVSVGETLAVLDTAELMQRVREAEAAELKAVQAYRAIEGWRGGLDAARARRTQGAALAAAEDTRQKLRETETLYRDGIIPRSELDSYRQQVRSDQAALASADDEWKALQQQASPANRRVAEIENRNAAERLQAVRQQLAEAVIKAPRGGTLVKPQTKQERSTDLALGASVTRGQPLFAIADRRHLSVVAKIDESDANRIREGQTVEVSGTAFQTPLRGRIVSISGEATSDSQPGTASFIVTAELDPLPANIRGNLRLGMTASMRIVVESRANVLVVPPAAIQGSVPNTDVSVIAADGSTHMRHVQIGMVSEQGVEILSGLKAGEKVAIPLTPADVATL